MLLAFLNSWVSSAAFCVLITAVFVIGWRRISQRLAFVQQRNKQLYARLFDPGARNVDENYWIAREVDQQIRAVEQESTPSRRQAMLRDFEVEAARLEGSVAFYVDLLRQLGLLGTVLGLGFALLMQGAKLDLLQPLSLAVWTTVVGLVWSILISWRFGREVEVHADECERNIEAWRGQLKRLGTSPPAVDQAG